MTEEQELELLQALSYWPALIDPQDEPCEVWFHHDPSVSEDRGAWSWHPGVIRERVGPNEWLIEVGREFTATCFRDLSEIRRPQGD